VGDNSYGDEIWCYMEFCAQVEEIGVGGGCDSILVRKITVRCKLSCSSCNNFPMNMSDNTLGCL